MTPILKFEVPGQRGNLEIVRYYRECGLNVMPLVANGNPRWCKAPKIKWAAYQLERIPDEIIYPYFSSPYGDPSGIGVICGSTSGNPELLDFDGGLLFDWLGRVEEELGYSIRELFPVVATPRWK